jgi:dihydroorotase-like cyclic amidohydrolase
LLSGIDNVAVVAPALRDRPARLCISDHLARRRVRLSANQHQRHQGATRRIPEHFMSPVHRIASAPSPGHAGAEAMVSVTLDGWAPAAGRRRV